MPRGKLAPGVPPPGRPQLILDPFLLSLMAPLPTPGASPESAIELRKLHWDVIPPHKLVNTFWTEKVFMDGDAKEGFPPTAQQIIDEEALGRLFTRVRQQRISAAPSTPTAGESGPFQALSPGSASMGSADISNSTGRTSVRRDAILLLDSKRASNVEIMLRAIKMPLSRVVKAIGDVEPAAFSPETLQQLLHYAPSLEEMEALRAQVDALGGEDALEGRLGRAEALFLGMADIPRLHSKLRVLQFRKTFVELSRDLEQLLATFEAAVTEAVGCRELQAFLHVVLRVGNRLNLQQSGSARGGGLTIGRKATSGFSLASLPRLLDTRSFTENGATLLHYITAMCEVSAPQLLQMGKVMPSVGEASRHVFEEVRAGLQDLQDGVAALAQEVLESEKDAAKMVSKPPQAQPKPAQKQAIPAASPRAGTPSPKPLTKPPGCTPLKVPSVDEQQEATPDKLDRIASATNGISSHELDLGTPKLNGENNMAEQLSSPAPTAKLPPIKVKASDCPPPTSSSALERSSSQTLAPQDSISEAASKALDTADANDAALVAAESPASGGNECRIASPSAPEGGGCPARAAAQQKRDALLVFQEQAQGTVEALEGRLAAVQASFRDTVTFYGQTLAEADLTSREPARFFGLLWYVVTSIETALKQRVKLRACLELGADERPSSSPA